MISTIVVTRKSDIGEWHNHEWTEICDSMGHALRRCTELNRGWLHRKKLDHKATVRFRQNSEVLGTCDICSEAVLDGDEHDDPEGVFDYPIHQWCPKSLDQIQDLYPTYRESIR